jgi:hypothetical protein
MSTVAFRERPVSFDTSGGGSDLPLTFVFYSYFDRHCVPCRICEGPLGQKTGIHATAEPRTTGGVAPLGHVDTTPVDGRSRSSDPLIPRCFDGRPRARGSWT